MFKTIKSESGFSLIGFILLVLLAAAGIYLIVQLIRPAQASGRFKTAVDGVALSAMNKTDGQIRSEILGRAGEVGVALEAEDITIEWGPEREFLEIEVEYRAPVNLCFFNYERRFDYLTRRELSRAKRIMDRVERSVRGSYDGMAERARKAGQTPESPGE